MALATEDVQAIALDFIRKLEETGKITVQRAVLFGSYARGRAHRGSDIDLLVISRDFMRMTAWERIRLVARVTAQCDRRLEVIPCTPRQWERAGPASFLAHIRRTGIVVYEARHLEEHSPAPFSAPGGA